MGQLAVDMTTNKRWLPTHGCGKGAASAAGLGQGLVRAASSAVSCPSVQTSPGPLTWHTLCGPTQPRPSLMQAVRAPHFPAGGGEDDSHPKDGAVQQNLP